MSMSGVWEVSEGCLQVALKMCIRCLEGGCKIWKVFGTFLQEAWKVSGSYFEVI